MLLSSLGEIRVPPAVGQELRTLKPRIDVNAFPWLSVSHLDQVALRTARYWRQSGVLDPGEAEALALARQIGADWFLTDDTAARLFSTSIGIEVHGSLGVVLAAAALGNLNRAKALDVLDRLDRSSLWISRHILGMAKDELANLISD